MSNGLLPNQLNKVKSSGLLRSHVPGRTDRLPINVHGNSYVIPADVVSGLGQGNTLAGSHLLDHMFHGMKAKKNPTKRADGGATSEVPVMVAGGEYVVHPDTVVHLGEGNYKKGHRVLDTLVKNVRSHTIKTLRKLPSPKK